MGGLYSKDSYFEAWLPKPKRSQTKRQHVVSERLPCDEVKNICSNMRQSPLWVVKTNAHYRRTAVYIGTIQSASLLG